MLLLHLLLLMVQLLLQLLLVMHLRIANCHAAIVLVHLLMMVMATHIVGALSIHVSAHVFLY